MQHIALFALLKFILITSFAQLPANGRLPVMKADRNTVSIRNGNVLLKDYWTLSPQIRPDVYEVSIKGRSQVVVFLSAIDSIRFDVLPGKKYQFYIINGADSALTEIRGDKYVEPAVFTKEYQGIYNGKTTVEIPEMYELVNIAMALTNFQKGVDWHDEKRTSYYKEVQDHFSPYKNERLVLTLDTLLRRGLYRYFKTDSYAFLFDAKGKIVKSKVYDRIDAELRNTLSPHLKLFQEFSDRSGFRKFYKEHLPFYNEQVKAYRDTINTAEMVSWLNRNFPSTRYNSFKIIWSPLVGGNQSAKWFDNNGFREAQAHVNFPYYFLFTGSKSMIDLKRGNIVFTELNHAYINPEAEKYEHEIKKAFTNNKYSWVRKGSPGDGYGMDIHIFNEYMNWGLISLRYVDYAQPDELDSLLRQNERNMLDRRGFLKFPEFNQQLVSLYRNRKPSQTLADLYPAIVAWFNAQANNSSAASGCNCGAAFSTLVAKVEKNYAGFSDKVRSDNREAYNTLTSQVRARISGAVYQNRDSCLSLLKEWISFFKDGHLNINAAGGNITAAIPPDSIRRQFSTWPSLSFTETSFKEYLLRNKDKLHPLEGIWTNSDGNYHVGIVSSEGAYKAFILKADSIYWMPGQVKFDLSPKGELLQGNYYMRDHRAVAVTYGASELSKGILNIPDAGNWFKLDGSGRPLFRDYFPGYEIVSFKQLSGRTNLITIKSFDGNYRRVIDSVVNANDALIRNAENLIIDVRGNGGGSDIAFYSLRKYLFTNPYTRIGMEIRVTDDNLQKFRGLTTDPILTKEEQERYRKYVADAEKNMGQYWSSSPAVFMSDTLEVLRGPAKVAVIVDRNCASTTEQFLIDPVMNSKKATIYGEPSMGVLDYANNYFFNLPECNFRVNYPTSRSKRVAMGKGIDNVGVQPHVRLDKNVPDWVKYVQEQMEGKRP